MQRSGRGGSWIGWLIFLFLVFGVRFLPPVATWLSQVTGLTITVPMLIMAVVGLTLVVSIVGAVTRTIGEARGPDATDLPTTTIKPPMPTAPSLPPPKLPKASSPWPTSAPSSELPRAHMPSGKQQLPRPPRFEPIIDPRILLFGILGIAVLGGLVLLFLFLSGALP